jgi:hypothetical protein
MGSFPAIMRVFNTFGYTRKSYARVVTQHFFMHTPEIVEYSKEYPTSLTLRAFFQLRFVEFIYQPSV